MRFAAVKHFVACVRILSALLFISFTPMYCKSEVVLKGIAKAFNKFGDDVYKEVAKTKGNIVFSPFSVSCSLLLLTLGADGDTQLELLSKISVGNVQNLKNKYETVIKYMHNISNQDLHLANNLFITKKYGLLEKYQKEVMGIFVPKPQQVDYTKPAETKRIMNAWVANQTDRAIRNIVDAHSFNKHTFLLLLNAIHFRSTWTVKFDKTTTMPNYDFHTPKGTTRCNMMVMKQVTHDFYSNSNILMLSLSLSKTDIKIAFISTIGNTTITEIDRKLNSKTFLYMVSQLRRVSLIIKIPRIKVESKYSLKQILISIGLSQIFQKSNFSNMFRKPMPTPLDQVIQKAVIEINEAGATKFSAQENGRGTHFARIFRKFVLDKSFLFILYDSKSEVILLRGRIEEPNN